MNAIALKGQVMSIFLFNSIVNMLALSIKGAGLLLGYILIVCKFIKVKNVKLFLKIFFQS